jgi:hypothetical protein
MRKASVKSVEKSQIFQWKASIAKTGIRKCGGDG